jgi:hypothetical protein
MNSSELGAETKGTARMSDNENEAGKTKPFADMHGDRINKTVGDASKRVAAIAKDLADAAAPGLREIKSRASERMAQLASGNSRGGQAIASGVGFWKRSSPKTKRLIVIAGGGFLCFWLILMTVLGLVLSHGDSSGVNTGGSKGADQARLSDPSSSHPGDREYSEIADIKKDFDAVYDMPDAGFGGSIAFLGVKGEDATIYAQSPRVDLNFHRLDDDYLVKAGVSKYVDRLKYTFDGRTVKGSYDFNVVQEQWMTANIGYTIDAKDKQ